MWIKCYHQSMGMVSQEGHRVLLGGVAPIFAAFAFPTPWVHCLKQKTRNPIPNRDKCVKIGVQKNDFKMTTICRNLHASAFLVRGSPNPWSFLGAWLLHSCRTYPWGAHCFLENTLLARCTKLQGLRPAMFHRKPEPTATTLTDRCAWQTLWWVFTVSVPS